MIFLKKYENYFSDGGLGTPTTEDLCKYYNIKTFTFNTDGSIDVNEDVQLHHTPGVFIDKIPIKFKRVSGSFTCNYQGILTMENFPEYVGRNFNCSNNKKLTTLLKGPKYVGGGYYVGSNNLRDVHGFPESFAGIVNITDNPIWEIARLIERNDESKFINLLNEFNVIRNGDTIVKDRLEMAFDYVGIEVLEFDGQFIEFNEFVTKILNYKLI